MNMHTLKMFSFSLVALSLLASLTPAESQAAKLADGQRCSTNSACQSGSCTPGPSYFPNSSGPKYCLNRNLNCALPGTAGARYGQNYSFKGNTLKCLNPGLYGWGRLSAQFMLPVDKNHAPIKAPLKKVELCVGAIHARSYYEAYVTEGTCRDRGGGWYPGAVITLVTTTPVRHTVPARRRYSNYNYQPPSTTWGFGSGGGSVFIPTCAVAKAQLDDGRVLTKFVCERRSYQ